MQIVRHAPWELTDEFLTENKIDFVAHDEIPYGTDNNQDIYADIKARGMFVATDRTEGKINHCCQVFLVKSKLTRPFLFIFRCFHIRHRSSHCQRLRSIRSAEFSSRLLRQRIKRQLFEREKIPLPKQNGRAQRQRQTRNE